MTALRVGLFLVAATLALAACGGDGEDRREAWMLGCVSGLNESPPVGARPGDATRACRCMFDGMLDAGYPLEEVATISRVPDDVVDACVAEVAAAHR